MLQGAQTQGRLNKAWGEGCPLRVDTKNAELRGHMDIWHNSQDKEETKKPNSPEINSDW